MGGFFEVGSNYANRLGEYEVVEVATPRLKIRYVANGRLQDVDEELQERIVRNLRRELERAASAPEERAAAAAKTARPKRKRTHFEGFNATDFQGSGAGSGWRTKTSLGGWLAQSLADTAAGEFDSWAADRMIGCYVTSPAEAAAKSHHDSAQFFVTTSPEGLVYGLEVHRPADAAEGTTAWDRFISALSDDEHTAATLQDLLTSEKAELTWYSETFGRSERQRVRGEEDGLLLDRGAVTESDSFDAVIERLNEAPTDQPLVLTIEGSMSPQEAISAGTTAAQTILDLFGRLITLYEACKG
ncbi:MAG: hypothetical protein IT204_15485 [Fimbriimonadaceae bacterium]|nr:hypothetical protein [Fimbriimonadaceae bacterium]